VRIIAVIGGTGFIGNKLVHRLLAEGDRVRVLTRRATGATGLPDVVSLYPGDLADGANALKPFVDGVDILYHCATELRDEARMYPVHVLGTRNLVEAAEKRSGRLVQLSSVGVYS